MAPTTRPSDTSRLDLEGLYVFRYFNLLRSDVDEFVRLSERGWLSFEHHDEFAIRRACSFATTPTAPRCCS
jgi:hypothetical protein